jgi:hypothetical protein
MSNPQQPELRRSGKSAAAADSADVIPDKKVGARRGTRSHGMDKGGKGGGKGGKKTGGVPPEQLPPYPV